MNIKHSVLTISFFLFLIAAVSTAEAGSARWKTSVSVDEMTGKTSAYAFSPSVGPTKSMNWPYHTVKAWLGVGCDGKSEWVYIGFSEAPNLSIRGTEEGYYVFGTRVKWDSIIENETLTQGWGENFIHFEGDRFAISKIESGNSVLVELPWHGNGKVYFKFPLNGSSAALKSMRDKVKTP
ncbi:MAG: hypothetical protein HUN04_14750 [Desulfobacter sp.]|nr:MAG: hypothetical protein HUN04_14750 [Desulfobacter sp.]